MFVDATKINPRDCDVWTVLGVLYHITSDYDLAINAFKEAVKIKPDNAELWNKLGATFANSNNNNDAIGPYERALQLRPSYIRARSNLAIAYYNQGDHHNAVSSFIDTLSQSSDHPHLWSLMRLSLTLMGRDDLSEVAKAKDASALSQIRDALRQ